MKAAIRCPNTVFHVASGAAQFAVSSITLTVTPIPMSELDNIATGMIPERPKRDPSYGQLRPLANRRPELYEEDEYSSADYERMMELYQGSMASIDEGEIVKAKVQSVPQCMDDTTSPSSR